MRRSGLFLIELLLALLFFSLTSAVCMKVFGTSALLTREKKDQDAAAEASVCAAECLKSCEGDLERTAELLGNDAEYREDTGVTLPCGEELTLHITQKEKTDEYVICTVYVTDADGAEVHTMDISALSGKGGAA